MPETKIRRFQCRHIFADGHRCGSKCLRNEEFCYYHHTTRRPAPPGNLFRDVNSSFDFPIPEDRSAIRAGIGVVLQRVAQGQLDPRRASIILYGLQIATLNLPKPTFKPIDSVDELIADPALGPMAPVAELDTSLSDAIETSIYRRLAQTASASQTQAK